MEDIRCSICGGNKVPIRGRFPSDEKRFVCPTCLQERMDQINEISSRGYGQAYQNIPNDLPLPPSPQKDQTTVK